MEQNNRIHDVAMSNEHVLMMMMMTLGRFRLTDNSIWKQSLVSIEPLGYGDSQPTEFFLHTYYYKK